MANVLYREPPATYLVMHGVNAKLRPSLAKACFEAFLLAIPSPKEQEFSDLGLR